MVDGGIFSTQIATVSLTSSSDVKPRLSSSVLTSRISGMTTPVPLAPVGTIETRANQDFLQLSQSPSDSRVAFQGWLVPRTFATTFIDSRLAPSELAAVDRYALSKPIPATYSYTIVSQRAQRFRGV